MDLRNERLGVQEIFKTRLLSTVPATKVTCVREVQPQAPSNVEVGTKNRFYWEGNAGDAPTSCKFFLPLKIAEQGLNVHVHLVQLLKLAQALNSTLVLPNEMEACRHDVSAFITTNGRYRENWTATMTVRKATLGTHVSRRRAESSAGPIPVVDSLLRRIYISLVLRIVTQLQLCHPTMPSPVASLRYSPASVDWAYPKNFPSFSVGE